MAEPAEAAATRPGSRRVPALTAFIAALLAPGLASAQQLKVGRIDRIAEVRGGLEPVHLVTPSDRAEIGRGAQDAWSFARRDQDVFRDDRLRVRRYIDVRVRVETPTQRGQLTFAPEVLLRDGSRVFELASTASPSEYVMPEDTTAQGELAVLIRSGALLVDWDAGRLVVIAAGHSALVVGTRAAFVMDSTGNDGWLYVDEGTITFPGAPGMAVGPGQLVRLQAGVPISGVSNPGPGQANAYQNATRYHANQVWARFTPFWQKPQFVIPALSGIAVLAGVIATQTGDDGGPLSGTVVIRIPF
jgi:hypothetical protein